MTEKNLALSKALKSEVREFVYQRRLPSMSSIVAEIIVDYANRRIDVAVGRTPMYDDEIKYTAPPEYDAALQRAKSEGKTLSDVIRIELRRRVSVSDQPLSDDA